MFPTRQRRLRRVLTAAVVVAATGSTLLASPAWADEEAPSATTVAGDRVPVAPAMTQRLDDTVREGTRPRQHGLT
ncbi:hypothetical protein [Streptomyces sp. NPDC048496]|uniref:hypothetical protein n=1 Tax=Streptomyces sp. NPDC048496 TaxID=3365558 RepID=UPI0037188D95